jgi:ribose-phosphate pyrophosphokinase
MSLDVLGTDGSIYRVSFATYPDTTPLVNGIAPAEVVLSRPESFSEFVATMFYFDAMRFRGLTTPDLILPMVPGQRQDRLNQSGDVLFTAKSVADMINARNIPCVTILDPHSDVTPALIERCQVVHSWECINPPAGKYAAVVSPDAGAEKRAGHVANKLGIPLLHAWKTRDVQTGKISGFGMQPHDLPEGSLVLVVDDICDAGGTFLGLADTLDNANLKAHLWTTHGLFTRGTADLLKRYGHVYCTDSTCGPRDGIIKINICERLLRGETL